MAEMIYKVLDDCEVKKLTEREYEFTASTSIQDRDGEVIEALGWDLKNFKKNPVIMYAHDYRSLPIGKAPRVWVSDGKLKNTVEFPPEGTYEFADIVERLVGTGYLKTESVGFIPKKWEDGDGEKAPRRTYTKQELLEISIVPVPSNPDALRNAVDEGVITTKELETITKPEETDDFIHIPVRECNITATIDISKKEGIKAKYCGKEKQVGTYLFDKREPYNWTMVKAKKWVEDHKGKMDVILNSTENEPESLDFDSLLINVSESEVPKRREYSQAGIIDELDYLIRCLNDVGMNEDAIGEAWNLVREVMRLTGDDIPDDIQAKIGAVLNQKNKGRLREIQKLAQEILDSAEHEEEPKDDKPKVIEPEITIDQVIGIVKGVVAEVVAKAQGKV